MFMPLWSRGPGWGGPPRGQRGPGGRGGASPAGRPGNKKRRPEPEANKLALKKLAKYLIKPYVLRLSQSRPRRRTKNPYKTLCFVRHLDLSEVPIKDPYKTLCFDRHLDLSAVPIKNPYKPRVFARFLIGTSTCLRCLSKTHIKRCLFDRHLELAEVPIKNPYKSVCFC